MSAIRFLSSSRHLLRRNALPLGKAGEAARGCHVVAVPPRNKVPSGELFVMGSVLVASLWTVPLWIIYHVPDYQNEDRNQYTGK